jgi:predicted esterase
MSVRGIDRKAIALVVTGWLALFLFAGACGTKSKTDPGATAGTTAAQGGAQPGVGGTTNINTNGGASALGGSKGTAAVGNGGSTGTKATGGSGGKNANAGGKGGGNAGKGGGTSTSGKGPKIPEAKGECPTFKTGTATIMNLATQMVVGTPGSVKGSILFAFHGTGGSAMMAMAQVPSSVQNDITSEGGIVIAYTGGGASRGTDTAPPMGAFYVEDLDYVDLVVACAVKNNNIDPRRIYATGCSAGGIQAGTMGVLRSEYVAAVAPNSGGINYANSRVLSDKTHAPAAFSMHGGASDQVIISFTDSSMWMHDQLKLADSVGLGVDCNHGGAHCGAPTDLHVKAWEFMKAHPFGVSPEPYKDGLPSGFPDYCKIVTPAK